MKLFVFVKPNAKVAKVEKVDETHFTVFVPAPPTEGRANEAMIEALSDYFKMPKSRFSIIVGANSRRKIIECVS